MHARFFAGATIVASAPCRDALAPGFPPVPLLKTFMPRFAAEFPKLKVVLPTVTFEDRMVLHDGDREIQLWHPGFAAHTVGDAVVFLPKERVLFAGDIAFHYVTPLAFQGHLGNWIRAADRLLRYDADVIVPGHGPIGTRTDLKRMRDYLILVRREAKRRFDAGMPAEAAAADIELGVYASWRTSCGATRNSATSWTSRWTCRACWRGWSACAARAPITPVSDATPAPEGAARGRQRGGSTITAAGFVSAIVAERRQGAAPIWSSAK